MGVPTSEVGYTSAMLRRESPRSPQGHVGGIGGGGPFVVRVKSFLKSAYSDYTLISAAFLIEVTERLEKLLLQF